MDKRRLHKKLSDIVVSTDQISQSSQAMLTENLETIVQKIRKDTIACIIQLSSNDCEDLSEMSPEDEELYEEYKAALTWCA